MAGRKVTLSQREIDRLGVIQAVAERRLKQRDAARQLGLSARQVKRLLRRYREEGAAGLASRHRGKTANNALGAELRTVALALVRERYADFGPTLAHEKLTERHELQLSRETLRQWMSAEGLWQPKARPRRRRQPPRARRPCRGELVQIDGSPHDWFERRGPRCTLIVFIDDATSELMAMRFAPAETTEAYMATLADYLTRHGRPVALYSDRHGIFRNNHRDAEGELTQFSRALATLDIEAIHAHTPQAKGRVERAHQTLQHRLIKELRLAGISDIDTANAFLAHYIADYNRRFAVAAERPSDAHRALCHSAEELELILSLHHQRTLTKDLTVRFRGTDYHIDHAGRGHRFTQRQITVCEGFDGTLTLLHQGRRLAFRALQHGERPAPLADEKSLHHHVEVAKAEQAQRPAWKPAPDHPWKRPFARSAMPG